MLLAMKEIIVIIGGGIAGMEAAGQLLNLGYSPIIIEKADHLGGHVADWNRLFPDMTPASEIVADLKEKCKDANIFLNTTISFINRLKDGYNIMLSNGISIRVTSSSRQVSGCSKPRKRKSMAMVSIIK